MSFQFDIRKAWVVLPVLFGVGSCEMASDVDLITLDGLGAVEGVVYRDQNGNRELDLEDQLLDSIQVTLAPPGSQNATEVGLTDSLGAFTFSAVPTGQYEVLLPPSIEGDTITVFESSPGILTVNANDIAQARIGLTYPLLSLPDALVHPQGRRIFTAGIALNSRDPFGDGIVHFSEGAAFLRATNVARAGLGPGDSVRVLGTTAVSGGRPILDDVTPVVLVSSAVIPPVITVTTAQAASAQGGPLDAALVEIGGATIESSVDLGQGAYRLRVDDGSGDLLVEIAAFLAVNPAQIQVGQTVVIGLGLLRPGTSPGVWRLHPRNASDLTTSSS